MRCDGGFTLQFRSIWTHRVFQSKQEAAVFSWMKDEAAWRSMTVRTPSGSVALERGQLVVTERSLAEDFGLLRSQVRSLIKRMIADQMLTKVSTMVGAVRRTILTIVNYDAYQRDRGHSKGSENLPETPVDNHVQPKVSPSSANPPLQNNDLQAPNKAKQKQEESHISKTPESVAVRARADDPTPQTTEPDETVEEGQVFSEIDVGPEEQRDALPEEAGHDHKAWLRKIRRDQLGQKLQRFCLATMKEADRMKAFLGLMGCDPDPDHDDKWWFEHVNNMRKRARWDDKREGNYAHTQAMRAAGACV